MRITPALLYVGIAWALAFPVLAGEQIKSAGVSTKGSPATSSVAAQPPSTSSTEVKNAAATSLEDAIRAEIDQCKEQIKQQEATLKAMWNARDIAGTTTALRIAADDKRRIMELKQRLKDMKKKSDEAKNAATASATPATTTVAGSGQ